MDELYWCAYGMMSAPTNTGLAANTFAQRFLYVSLGPSCCLTAGSGWRSAESILLWNLYSDTILVVVWMKESAARKETTTVVSNQPFVNF